jgi:AraC family transcriptional regulator
MSAPANLASPDDWARRMSAPPVVSSDPAAWPGALVRRWRDVDAAMTQPPLDHHQIALHLGGPKRIRRSGEGPEVSADVALNALTFTSAGRAHSWSTQGPVDFAHLYVQPAKLDRVAEEEFGRDGARVELADAIGRLDPLLASVITEMVRELGDVSAGSRLYLDTLLSVTLVKVLRDHSRLDVKRASSHLLSPRRLRRVLDYVEAHLETEIALDDLARVAGASPYRFGQAFRRSVGATPYAYVLDQRVERAKRLLRETAEPVSEIAWACGFNSPTQFSTIFKRRTGVSPRRFRQDW